MDSYTYVQLIEDFFTRKVGREFYSHISLDEVKSCLLLRNEDDFYRTYAQLVVRKRNMFLAEKPGPTGPFRVDVDVKNPVYFCVSDVEVDSTISACFRLLRESLEITCESQLDCFVLQRKPRVLSDRTYKHGFHLHFPNLCVERAVHAELLTRLAADASHPMHPHVDTAIFRNSWLMYGSSKGKSKLDNCALEPYTLVRIVDAGMSTTDVDVYPFPRYERGDGTTVETTAEVLVRFLSINAARKPTVRSRSVVAAPAPAPPPHRGDLELVVELCSLLAPERAVGYDTWFEIGCCMYNAAGHDTLEAFRAFSATGGDAYDPQSCDALYASLARSGPGKKKATGTLVYLARKDDPEGVRRVLSAHRSGRVIDTDLCVAEMFHHDYPDKFVYGDRLEWFLFEGHVWTQCTKNPYNFFAPMLRELSHELRSDPEAVRVVRALESYAPAVNIIKMCAPLYREPRLEKVMDSNPNIIAFTNGVFDFERRVFRCGVPSDYLSKSLPVRYEEPDEDVRSELEDFFLKIFPDDEVREYFLDQQSKIFVGGNADKIAAFWTGSGNNGKSMTIKLFEKMLGPLAVKMPTSLISGKKTQAGAATPELARLNGGVRLMVFEEFNPDERIGPGMLKHLTGNDSLCARQLYCLPEDFQPLAKTVIICNRLPQMHRPDEATWNRVHVYPFESTFNARAPDCPEEQRRLKHFKCDSNISRRFDVLAVALAHFLVRRYVDVVSTRSVEPPVPDKVRSATTAYMQKSNRVLQFAENELELVAERACDDGHKSDYKMFCDWFTSQYARNELPDCDEFVDEMARLEVGGRWYRRRTYGRVSTLPDIEP